MTEGIEIPHPHKIMAESVNMYDKIRPYLEKGNLEGIAFFIREAVVRGNNYFQEFEEKIRSESKRGAYTKWIFGLKYLTGLNSKVEEREEISKRELDEYFLPKLDKFFSELEIILYDDPIYKQNREITEN